ncbi:uncharacterized protein VTP21DRAFT_8624 [Calcarisporiella thermophila]|uniref:uncharacterized protein n=1 Tax=Calcarisporiella thermophila TaxID=911321 RepID=UPI0037422A09
MSPTHTYPSGHHSNHKPRQAFRLHPNSIKKKIKPPPLVINHDWENCYNDELALHRRQTKRFRVTCVVFLLMMALLLLLCFALLSPVILKFQGRSYKRNGSVDVSSRSFCVLHIFCTPSASSFMAPFEDEFDLEDPGLAGAEDMGEDTLEQFEAEFDNLLDEYSLEEEPTHTISEQEQFLAWVKYKENIWRIQVMLLMANVAFILLIYMYLYIYY